MKLKKNRKKILILAILVFLAGIMISEAAVNTISTGPGLNRTSINDTGTIVVNFSETQARVTANCSGGISLINHDGSGSCVANATSVTPQINYTIIPLLAGRSAVTVSLGSALNWSSFVYDFSDSSLPKYTSFRTGCSASVAVTQTGDIEFHFHIGTTENVCNITSDIVTLNKAVSNWIPLPTLSGNTTILLDMQDTNGLDNPVLYSAWIELKG